MQSGMILRALRKAKNLTQSDVASLLKTSRQYYSDYECEKFELPSRINGLFIGQNQYQNTVSNKIITVKYEKAGSVQNLLFVHLFNYEEIMNKNRIIY